MPRSLPEKKTGAIMALLILHEHQHPNSPSPSLHELMRATGYHSPNAIRRHLQKLEEEGMIKREYHRHRAIRLTERGRAVATLLLSKPKDPSRPNPA